MEMVGIPLFTSSACCPSPSLHGGRCGHGRGGGAPPYTPLHCHCRPPILRKDWAGDISSLRSPRPLLRHSLALKSTLAAGQCSGGVSSFPVTPPHSLLLLVNNGFCDSVDLAVGVRCQTGSSFGWFGVAENSRRPGVRSWAGRSKAKKNRGSGGRIEGPGTIAGSEGRTVPKGSPNRAERKIVQNKGNSSGHGKLAKPLPANDRKPSKGAAQILSQNAGKAQSVGTLGSDKVTDPNVRYPDDYYKYGRYGPYSFKAPAVGKPRTGTLANNLAVTFSTVKNMEEIEEMSRVDAIIAYFKRLMRFDEDIGVQHFFVFARPSRRMNIQNMDVQIPWKEWTLVAQVSVQSGEELDKWRLFSRLDEKIRNAVTKCVAWFRPDLIYVRKPGYQVRMEPQEEFWEASMHLLDPGEPSRDGRGTSVDKADDGIRENRTYYGKFCKLLDLHVDADKDLVLSTYEKLDEEHKLECLEHLLCTNPVELLHPFTRARMEQDRNLKSMKLNEQDVKVKKECTCKDLKAENNKQNTGLIDLDKDYPEEEESDFSSDETESGSSNNQQEQEEFAWFPEASEEMDDDDAQYHERFNQAGQLFSEEDGDEFSNVMNKELDGRQSNLNSNFHKDIPPPTKGSNPELTLKAAARPYTYFNLVAEIVMLRQFLLNNRTCSLPE